MLKIIFQFSLTFICFFNASCSSKKNTPSILTHTVTWKDIDSSNLENAGCSITKDGEFSSECSSDENFNSSDQINSINEYIASINSVLEKGGLSIRDSVELRALEANIFALKARVATRNTLLTSENNTNLTTENVAESISLLPTAEILYAQSALEYAYHLENLPEYSSISRSQHLPIGIEKPLADTSEIESIFQTVQALFFRNKLITLKWCYACGFSTDYYSKTIYVEYNALNKILTSTEYKKPESVLFYIFAHEFSHFVHEISAHPPLSPENGLSVNGNLSSYQDYIQPVIDNLNAEEKEQLYSGDLPEVLTLKINEIKEERLKTNAEVDVIATVNLIENGASSDSFNDILLFLDNSITENSHNPDVVLDFTNRRGAINAVLSR